MATYRLSCSVLAAAVLLLSACGSDKNADQASVDAPATPVVDAVPVEGAVASAPPTAARPVPGKVDVRPLIGQSEAGVQAMLGEPSACEVVATGRKCSYPRGQTEVVFIDGMADWITISDLGGAPFAAATLSRIGLGDETPVVDEPDVIRWDNVGGMREISLYPKDGRAGYIQIKTMTL